MDNQEERLDKAVVDAIRARDAREQGYRAQSLKIHPWVCGRCGREFNQKNLHELTVHHKDHNHDNNPPDGSNWENLCIYCHDNEHARLVDPQTADAHSQQRSSTPMHKPFSDLGKLLSTDPATASTT